MDVRQYSETMELIINEVGAIIHAQKVLADIHDELDRNTLAPFEQDIIYREHFGCLPSEPRAFVHHGVTITTRILHQTGMRLRDVVGADLLYEIENDKYALIQFKRADQRTKRVKNDIDQFDSFLGNCPEICMYRKNPPRRVPARLNHYCGCWYRVDYDSEVSYVHACEAAVIYNGRASAHVNGFESGLSRDTFLDLFASCRIGALVRVQSPERYVSRLLEMQH